MRLMTEKLLKEFEVYLIEEEKGKATIRKYLCDLKKFQKFAESREVSKTLTMEYKEYLLKNQDYEVSSVNSFLVALNCFLDFAGWSDAKVKTCKVQKAGFAAEEKYLTKDEYGKKLFEKGISVGQCMHRIFHALIKREWLNRFKIVDYEHAHSLVFEYIETFYNTVRIHSHCGYISPNEYEKEYRKKFAKMECRAA